MSGRELDHKLQKVSDRKVRGNRCPRGAPHAGAGQDEELEGECTMRIAKVLGGPPVGHQWLTRGQNSQRITKKIRGVFL